VTAAFALNQLGSDTHTRTGLAHASLKNELDRDPRSPVVP
jgi:hypothetical protein